MRETDEIRSLMSSADPASDVRTEPRASADELIDRAAERSTDAATPPKTAFRGPVRRLLWPAVGATAVAAAVAAAIVIPGFGEHAIKPAYAVTVQHNGKVRVEIKELNNAADFQRKMLRAGVRTEVEDIPDGTHCKNGGGPHRFDGISYKLHWVTKNKALAKAVIIDPDKIGRNEALIVETHGTRVTLFYIAKAPHRCTPVPY